MLKDLLKLSILPILAIIIYIFCNYLFNSLFGFSNNSMVFQPHFVNPISFLGSYIRSYTVISTLLPIFAIILLFTAQYSLTSINIKNILYIVDVIIIVFIIIKLLFSFILPISYFLKIASEDDSFLPIHLILQWRSIVYIAIFVTSLGFISHFYLKIKDITINPIIISAKTNSYLVAGIYSLLVVITSLSYAKYFLFPYRFDHLIYFIIPAAISFMYLYSWTYQHLKTYFNSECYAINTTKAYAITLACYLVLSAIAFIIFIIIFLTRNILFYDILYLIEKFTYNTSVFFIIIFYAIAMVLIIKLAGKADSKTYKIFHYLLFSIITLLLICIAVMFGVGVDIFLIAHGIVICALSFSIWIGYFFTKFALDRSFR